MLIVFFIHFFYFLKDPHSVLTSHWPNVVQGSAVELLEYPISPNGIPEWPRCFPIVPWFHLLYYRLRIVSHGYR